MSGPWSNQVTSLIILTEASTGFSGLFGYSPTPGAGNLVFSVAAGSGTDPYGNAYPAGVSLGPGNAVQVTMVNSGGAGVLAFQLNNSDYLNPVVNAAIQGSPAYASMGLLGPATTIPGFADYVEMAFNSANISGSSTANLGFFYVNTSGGVTTVCTMNGSGASFPSGASVTDGLTTDTLTVEEGAEITGGLTVDTINGSNQTGEPNDTGFFDTTGLASGAYGRTHQHTLPSFPTSTHGHPI